jgi:hypothetical protein
VEFSDSEFVSYDRKSDDFVVLIDAWNGTRLTVSFSQCEGVLDLGIGDISDFIEETESDQFFEQIISRIYTNLPDDHPYHLYQFLGLDGEPVLEVVAETVRVSV